MKNMFLSKKRFSAKNLIRCEIRGPELDPMDKYVSRYMSQEHAEIREQIHNIH